MMRSFGKFVLTVSALALVASPALAQNRGGSGGGGAAGFLMAPNVQRDLKLNDNQVKRLNETLREITERHHADYTALRDASADVRWTRMATLNETVSEEVKTALSFSTEQSKRYDQICVQAHGLLSFASRCVDDKLKLTDDQKSKIREIAEATQNAFASQASNDSNASEQDRAQARDKRTTAHKENMAKVEALLTDDQKQGWRELIGEPINIDYPTRRSND